jgi:hypothetical protein
MAVFKENIYQKLIHRQIVLHYIYNINTKNMGLTNDHFCGQRCHQTADHKKSDFKVKYLREYKAICKKALTCGSGTQMELFDEKKPEFKNFVTGSL